jgi:hypothetical protein
MPELLPFEECIRRLRDRVRLHLEAGEEIFHASGKLTIADMLAAAVLNRSIALIGGFCDLIPKNYICAAPLVRLQLDNVLRFSTLWLVSDLQNLVTKFMEGEQINKLSDRDGQRMTDRYLVDKMKGRHPAVEQVYDDACGYVHLSDAHLFHTFTMTGERSMRMEIGADFGVTEENRKDAVVTMDGVTRLLLSLMRSYIGSGK